MDWAASARSRRATSRAFSAVLADSALRDDRLGRDAERQRECLHARRAGGAVRRPAAAAQDEAGRQALLEEADAVLDPRHRRLTEPAIEPAAAAQDHDEGLGPDVLGDEERPGEPRE